jgi:hypothetical protein
VGQKRQEIEEIIPKAIRECQNIREEGKGRTRKQDSYKGSLNTIFRSSHERDDLLSSDILIKVYPF